MQFHPYHMRIFEVTPDRFTSSFIYPWIPLNYAWLGFAHCILFYSYTSLVFPSGYTKLLGDSPTRNFQHVVSIQNSRQSTTEVKRVRLTQERLLKQCRISFGIFNLFNLLCLIIFVGKCVHFFIKTIIVIFCKDPRWNYSRF